MGDFRLLQESAGSEYDIDFDGLDFVVDDGLKASVVVSLFSDGRISADEKEDYMPTRRGWWGDTFRPDNDLLGSKLWTLAREKQTSDLLDRIESFASDALAWMLEDGVAREVLVSASFPEPRVTELSIEIVRPTGTGEDISFRFAENWEAENAT